MRGSREISPVPSLHRASTDALIYQSRKNQRVDLCRSSATSPTGMYHCDIATVEPNQLTRKRVHVGLYAYGGGLYTDIILFTSITGDMSISGDFTLTVDTDGASPQFILTCISTGGPATTVTWTRDSTPVTEGNETVLVNPITAVYLHTLKVTGDIKGRVHMYCG